MLELFKTFSSRKNNEQRRNTKKSFQTRTLERLVIYLYTHRNGIPYGEIFI